MLRDPRLLPVAVTAVLVAVYLVTRPLSSDLAAQVARADVAHRVGAFGWWTGWLGGLSMPSYSVLVPASMAALGVRTVGVAGAVVTVWGGWRLLRDTPRPRLGAAALALSSFADLVTGRITFAAGAGLAVLALVALRSNRVPTTVVLAVLAYLASPLAGLFLGLVAVAVLLTRRDRRRVAAVVGTVLLVAGATSAFLFPGNGVMPFRATDMIPPGIACVVVLVSCRQAVVRAAATLTLLALPAFYLVPGAVGGNICRLPWIAALPVVAACAVLPRAFLAAAMAGVAVWPATDVIAQVTWNRPADAGSAYYRPVEHALATLRTAAGDASTGLRVEAIDTKDHWTATYLSRSVSLARGWDRQADRSQNPLFYRPPLTAAAYHDWLHQLAVGWVVEPVRLHLDYASTAEAALVRDGLPYLGVAWSDADWRVYRVLDPAPLATGARVTAVDDGSVTLRVTRPGRFAVRVRWTPYLHVVQAASGAPAPACVTDVGGFVAVQARAAGTVRLVSDFDPRRRLSSGPGCG